ncbi:MAG: ATP-binding cassette domain-containing protein [Actinomycetia bacterium]|nr:ATP-binding cassette domain-containing protein [Actinomycetes bacterium]
MVHGIGFDAQSSETLCLLGPSGAGKSTTINILVGALRADAGSVEYLSTSIYANLAGSFFPTTQNDSVLYTVIRVLPQKALLSLAESLEQQLAIGQWYGWAVCIGILAVAYLVAATLKVRHDYARG